MAEGRDKMQKMGVNASSQDRSGEKGAQQKGHCEP